MNSCIGTNASSYNEKSEKFYVWRGHNTEEREKELPMGHNPGKATAEEQRFQNKPSTGSSGPEVLAAAGGSKHAANVQEPELLVKAERSDTSTLRKP